MLSANGSVIVVGAGLSGLCAARLLNEKGVDVCVLESTSRVGGRMLTIDTAETGRVDLGGAYVCRQQWRLLNLLAKYHLNTVKISNEGDSLCYRYGQVIRYSSSTPPLSGMVDKIESSRVQRSLLRLCDQISLNEPWKCKTAQTLDQISFKNWLDKNTISQAVKGNVAMLARANFCAEPHNVSFLWALCDMKAAGGMDEMNDCGDGTQELVVEGGSQQLPIALANELKEQAVVRIQCHDDHVTVHCIGGKTFQADRVIVAIPPNAQQRIIFEPELSAVRRQLNSRSPMGSIIKTFTYYEKPFWREKGLSGLLTVEDDAFPVATCFDATHSDGSNPCLMGFIAGDKALTMSAMSKVERSRQIAAQYAAMFDLPQLREPVHYEDYDWSCDTYAAGGYSCISLPGTLTQYGWTIRKPERLIHFAGTETSTVWPGYMEGAIEAGHRAAREILLAMNKYTADFDDEEVKANQEPSSGPKRPAREHGSEMNTLEDRLPSAQNLFKIFGVSFVSAAAAYCLLAKL